MAKTAYVEYLEFCGFEGELLEKTLPDWMMACEKLELDEEELRWSMNEWLPQNFDIDYKGVRMAMGAWILEAIECCKMEEYKKQGKKIVYGIIPSNVSAYYGIKQAGGDKVAVSFPDLVMMVFNQSFFGRGGKYFEVAEQAGMTYGARHCGLNKMRIGVRLKNIIPTPDVDWAWGTVCDEATKIDEYINALYDEEWRTVVTRLPHDTMRREKQWEMPDRVKFFAEQIRLSMREVEEIIGFEVTDQDVNDGFAEVMQCLMLVGRCMQLANTANPRPIRGSTLSFFGGPAAMPFNSGTAMTKAAAAVMIEELERDIAAGKAAYPKDAPKIAFYFQPWSQVFVDRIFWENGVICGESMNNMKSSAELTPTKYTDPYEKVAESWLMRVYSMGCQIEIDNWVEKLNTIQPPPDAFIAGFLDYDRWIGTLHKKMLKEVEERTGIPCFYVEGDFYDSRDYSDEALRTRIESIAQIVKANKKNKAKAVK